MDTWNQKPLDGRLGEDPQVFSTRHVVLRRAMVALLFAGALVASPTAVQAECGHYVLVLSEASIDDAPENPGAPVSGDSSPATPCRGPSCSSHWPVPVAPISTPASPAPIAKAAVVGSDDPVDAGSHRLGILPVHMVPIDRSDVVFEPPRA
jgi:hypothetical protein